mmetsp:Transcript_32767/g.31230  ORF Transcript_32767/g.31230 Transcript_32767/m.31230 type:complete len:832 (+) Transcript_32767:126-2621(+)
MEYSGMLKQQCLDDTGLYEWVKKSFLLTEGSLLIFFANNKSQLSLSGAKHAKEWSISSSIAGYGFDIIWSSGRMTSFLADDEGSCHEWVININYHVDSLRHVLRRSLDNSVNSREEFRNMLHLPQPSQGSELDTESDHTDNRHHNQNESYSKHRVETESDHTDHGHHNQNESDSKHRVDYEMELHRNGHHNQSESYSRHRVDHEMELRHKSNMAPGNIQQRIEKNDISYNNERYYRSKSIPIFSNETTIEFQSPTPRKKSHHGNKNSSTMGIETDSRYSHRDAFRREDNKKKAVRSKSNEFIGGRSTGSISDIPSGGSVSNRSSPGRPSSPSNRPSHVSQQSNRPSHVSQSIRASFDGGKSLRKRDTGIQDYKSPSLPMGESIEHSNNNIPSTAFSSENSALRSRNQQLLEIAEFEKSDADIARKQVIHLKEEFENLTFENEKKVHLMRQKESETYKFIQSEMESKLNLATAEQDQEHEVQARTAKDLYLHETVCLKEEFLEEIKKYSDELSEAIQDKDTILERETFFKAETIELKAETTELRNFNSSLTVENLKIIEICKNDRAAWEKERLALITASDQRIATLQDASELLVLKNHAEERINLTELSMKYNLSIKTMEINIREKLLAELSDEKIREISAMQKKFNKDIGTIKNEEMNKANIEMERMRTSYVDREKETSEDVKKSEGLHIDRIKRLEEEVVLFKKNAVLAEDRFDVIVNDIFKVEQGAKSNVAYNFKRLAESAKQAEALTSELTTTHVQLQECREREGLYRDQLARVVEDASDQNKMLIEAQKQEYLERKFEIWQIEILKFSHQVYVHLREICGKYAMHTL